MYQHGRLLTIRKALNEKQSLENPLCVSIWAQDPAYCATDTSILTESGVSTLVDPDGFLKMAELSLAPDAPIKQIVDRCNKISL
jgi:hypothetical protein